MVPEKVDGIGVSRVLEDQAEIAWKWRKQAEILHQWRSRQKKLASGKSKRNITQYWESIFQLNVARHCGRQRCTGYCWGRSWNITFFSGNWVEHSLLLRNWVEHSLVLRKVSGTQLGTKETGWNISLVARKVSGTYVAWYYGKIL